MRNIITKDKHGWIRIMESFISVMIVMGVLLVVIARQPQFETTTEEELTKVQRHILDQVKEDPKLRTEVLSGNLANVNAVIASLLPGGFSYETRACALDTVCSLGLPVNEEVFVEEAIISANLTTYEPTLLKLFFWKGEYPEGYEPECGNDVCEVGETVENCAEDCYVEPTEASLTLVFSDVNYQKEGIYHYYYHTRTFTESNGVGVTLTEGQICYIDKCDNKGSVNYRTESSGELIHTNKKFYTTDSPDEFTLKYWGTDDLGNDIYVEQKMCVEGSSATPNC